MKAIRGGQKMNSLKMVLSAGILVCLVSSTICFAAPGATTVCTVKDNKTAAVVFTSDDGFYNSIQQYIPLWQYYNLRGTVALVSGWVAGEGIAITDTPNIGVYHGSWAEWAALVNSEYLDIGNHTQSHPNLTLCNATQLEFEINGAKQRYDLNIPQYHMICLLCPGGVYNNTVINKAMEQHYACRVIDNGYNSFSPTTNDIYRLKRQQILSATAASAAKQWVDQAISTGTWIIEAFHGVNGEGWEPPPLSFFNTHWAYVDSMSPVLWCGKFNDVVKYIKERMAAVVTPVSSDVTKISLNLTDALDNAIFNYPLTLKTQVQASWSAVRVTQNGKNSIIIPKNEAGNYFAYYDAVPDSGQINLVPITLGTFANIASGKPVIVSSASAGGFGGANAVDGNSMTRWLSNANNFEWLYIDMGNRFYINRVVLNWAATYGTKYRIQVSDNAKTWTDLMIVRNSDGGTDDIAVSGNGRYVRMSGMIRNSTTGGYSINEIEVYGIQTNGQSSAKPLAPIRALKQGRKSFTMLGDRNIFPFELHDKTASVTLYDLKGRVVRKAYTLKDGIYIVQIKPPLK
jgi:peptidoglycan/xylan/chitin deacetylase (PgdA/CDA1 family)